MSGRDDTTAGRTANFGTAAAGSSGRSVKVGKARTQERILRAATQLFIEQGYKGTSVLEIAQSAGVSRATVFWHFSDKASVFREAFASLLAPFRENIEHLPGDIAPEKRLEEQLAMSEQFAHEHRDEIRAFLRWPLEAPELHEVMVGTLLDLNQRFAGALAETISSFLPRDHDPKLMATALMLAFDASLLLDLFDRRTHAREERSTALRALVNMIARDARRT